MAKRDGLSTSKHICYHPFRKRRQESAAKLAAERSNRTDKQQLALLDNRFGPDQGAKKERERLLARIETAALEEAKSRDHKAKRKE